MEADSVFLGGMLLVCWGLVKMLEAWVREAETRLKESKLGGEALSEMKTISG